MTHARASLPAHAAAPRLQKKSNGAVVPADAPDHVHHVLGQPGAALDPATCENMGARFNHDFSQVRVHADPIANDSARAAGALAYTTGNHVVFDHGRFAPQTRPGSALLAHELTHVVQQSRGGVEGPPAGAAHEAEADAAARNLFTSQPISVNQSAAPTISHADEEPDIDVEEEEDDLLSDPARRQQAEQGWARSAQSSGGKPDEMPPPKVAGVAKEDPKESAKPPPPAVPDANASGTPPAPPPGDQKKIEPPTPMRDEAAYNYLLGLRGHEASLGVDAHEFARKQIEDLKTPAGQKKNAEAILALEQQIKKLDNEKRRFATRAKKGPLSDAEKERQREMRRERAQHSADLTLRRKDPDALQNKLAVSVPGGPGKTTRSEATYALIELVDANGKLVQLVDADDHSKLTGSIPAKNRPFKGKGKESADLTNAIKAEQERRAESAKAKGQQAPDTTPGVHAEQAIIDALEKFIVKNSPLSEDLKKKLAGGQLRVTVDQEVCTHVCQKYLRDFAVKYGMDRVTERTFHGVKPDAHGSDKLTTQDVHPAKTSAMAVTSEAESARLGMKPDQIAVRTQDLYDAKNPTTGRGQKGDPALPPAEVARLKPQTPPTIDLDGGPEPATKSAEAAKAPAPPQQEAATKTPPPKSSTTPDTPDAAPKPAHTDTPEAATKPKAGAPTPKGAGKPSPSSSSRATPAIGKAEMGLAAIRDFKMYKEKYLKEGYSDAEATALAAGRAGLTLGVNLKAGEKGPSSWLAHLVNFGNAYERNREGGQSKGEATATGVGTVAGGLIANKVAPTGPVGAAVNLANTGAQALGAPQPVQDLTYGAAELVPSNIIATTVSTGFRGLYNAGDALLTGDTKGAEKMGDQMGRGELGPWLQGYTQWLDIAIETGAGDKKFTQALDDAAEKGKDSWANRVGSRIGEGLSDFGESRDAMGGRYGASVGGWAVAFNTLNNVARGDDWGEAWAKTRKTVKESRKEVDDRRHANDEAFKARVKEMAHKAKQEVVTSLTNAKNATVAQAEVVKHKVEAEIVEVKEKVEAKIDAVTTQATDAAREAKRRLDEGADKARAAASEKLSEGKKLLSSGWNYLAGD